MFRKYLILNLCFAIILVAAILQLWWLPAFVGYLIKPVFSALAVIILFFETKLRGRFHRRMLIALLAFMIGTWLLPKSNAAPITYVLLSFFIAQVYLIRAFYLDFSSAPELDKSGARVAILFGVLFSFSTYIYLRPFLGQYRIAALIYSFLITLVMMMAFFRRFRVNQSSFVLTLLAAAFLAIASVLFAINEFIGFTTLGRVLVDVAYIISIYLMVVGAIQRKLVVSD